MMKKKSLLTLLAILMFLVFLVGCRDSSSFNEFTPAGPQPAAKLVFEAKWGSGRGELGESTDVWSPSFEYYFVHEEEVFIADQINKEVKYYKAGKFMRSYDYGFAATRLFGIVATERVIYLFFDLGGAAGISMETGNLVYSRGFPFLPDQNRYSVYQYGKMMIISEAVFEEGSAIRICLMPGLLEVKCPNFSVPHRRAERSPYQYLSLGRIAFFHALRQGNKVIPRIISRDEGMHKIQAVVFTESVLRYEMPGEYLITPGGVYYPVHTAHTAQIWFKPWWRGNDI